VSFIKTTQRPLYDLLIVKTGPQISQNCGHVIHKIGELLNSGLTALGEILLMFAACLSVIGVDSCSRGSCRLASDHVLVLKMCPFLNS
jgi:hypothetical protein